MVVQSNVPAINAHRNLGINNNALSKNLEKLSSGYKINRAGDDAAGLAISEKMRSQIRGLEMAEQNTENAISLIQTAEGGLNETHAILQRMRELAVQASNGTYTNEDRAQITLEYDALMEEVTRIADSTHYNGIKLLNGNLQDGLFLGSDLTEYTTSTESTVALAAAECGFATAAVGTITAATGTNGSVAFTNNDSLEVTIDSEGTITATITMQNGDTYTATGTAAAAGGNVLLTFEGTKGSGGTEADATITIATAAANADGTFNAGKLDVDFSGATAVATLAVANFSVGTETFGADLVFQIGANGAQDQRVSLGVDNMSAAALGIDASSVGTITDANAAIVTLDAAIETVSSQRASLGALQNRLEHTLNSLGVSVENLTAAESTIRDTDMAKEMMKFTQNSILVQASQAMLAQANALPQGILSLLG